MGHYYDAAGKPRHEYTNDKGKVIPMRFPRVAQENLFPSVSTVIKDTLANGQLVEYAKRQVAEAAWGNPPNSDSIILPANCELSNKEFWINSILEASLEDAGEAADLGTAVHASIENYLAGNQWCIPEHVPYLDCVRQFMAENHVEVLRAEHAFSDKDYGYGGTIDLACKVNGLCCIVDWKSRRTKPEDKKLKPYESHPLQIAAYAQAYFGLLSGDEPIGCNVYLSTTEPGRMDICWYSAEELRNEFTKFSHLLSYWQMAREYYPHKNLKRETK